MTDTTSMLSLIEGVYDAARGVRTWNDVVCSIADVLAADAVGLRRHDPEGRLDDVFVERRLTERQHVLLLREGLVSQPQEPAVEGAVVVGACELSGSPLGGLAGGSLGVLCVLSTRGSVGVDLVAIRLTGDPPFGEDLGPLRVLAAHLVRAGEIERDRLRVEDAARCFAATAEPSMNAALVVDGTLRIRARNAAADRLLRADRCFREEDGRLVPRDPAVRAALCRALACPAREPVMLRSGPAEGGASACLLLLQPLENAGPGDALPSHRLLVVTSDTDALEAPHEEATMAFFGLTRAEFRLATHLSAGERLDAAALALGISLETARTYLKALFRKTGTARQAALVRLLLLTPRPLHPEVPRSERRTAR